MRGYENILTAAILLALFIIVYCKYTNKTFGDFVREIKDVFSGGAEKVQEVTS